MDHVYDANGASEAIYTHASKEDFYAYLEKLDESGYVKYAENERGDVLSAIYTYGTAFTYNIFYEGGYKELCVLVEDYAEEKLPPKESEYKKVCETQFAQVGLEYQYTSSVKLSSVQNGMCYIWRLEDGRFIILDGGFNYANGAANLYNTLRKMAVNPNKIVVATWAVSHFHGDHVGTFASFVQNYLWDVEIQSMLINLPTLEQSKLDDMNWGYWNTISNKLGNFNKDLVVYKAHPGQVYHFANAEIEIIYTLEMFAPKDLTYYNTCTVIMDVSFGDFNMMMLGDCSEDANKIMLANYGNTLESEVVQVAHHGYQGGSNALYKAINPIYVFWPAGSTWYSTCEINGRDDPSTDRSGYLFMKNNRVEQIFAAKAYIYICGVQNGVGFTDCKRYQNVTALLRDEFTAVSLK
jgi:beta-lactamase superfamily II metal-dependent hydrolase